MTLKQQKKVRGKARVKQDKVSVSVLNSVISIRARLPESGEKEKERENERERERREALLETQTSTVLGHSELFQGLWESSQKVSC